MRYRMKQKLFTLADAFVIQDDAGHNTFTVDGKAFALGHEFVFRDMAGHELAEVKQKLLAWGTTYEVYRDNEAPAQHRETAHYQAWVAKVPDMLAEPRTRTLYSNFFPADADW